MLLGLLLHSSTLAMVFSMQMSLYTSTAIWWNNLTLFQVKSTFQPSTSCVTFNFQNGSGVKFSMALYRSTTKPMVGNWQDP